MKIMILILIIPILYSCGSTSTEPISQYNTDTTYNYINSIHVNLGVPTDKDTTNDYIIIRNQYVLSYNKDRLIPNWVSWELNEDWFGDVKRYDGNFITDTSLPTGFYRVKHSDYTNSGYDRGHLVRSEERTATEIDNKSTFILTNIIPQTPDLNRGVWLDLEYHCEDLCKNEHKELFLMAGGVCHSDSSLASGVFVPDSCFKIIVVLEKGQSLNDVATNTQVIAVMMPNKEGVMNDDWELYKTTIDRIEASTGYDFLNRISKEIQNIIESK